MAKNKNQDNEPDFLNCQYCNGMILEWDKDREDDDQCCTACFFFGYDFDNMMKKVREP